MFIPQPEFAKLMKEVEKRFTRSQFVLDMVPENQTRGIWIYLINLASRLDWGLNVSWVFGIKDSHDLEAYGSGFKVIAEEKCSSGPIITLAINPIA